MTKQEKIIISAFTGVLMCDFSDVHKYIEEKLGRPVWTHELTNKKVWDEIKEKTKEDFLEICEQEETERKKGKWIFIHPLQADDEGAYICSNCHHGDWDIKPTDKYCKFCGMAMDIYATLLP